MMQAKPLIGYTITLLLLLTGCATTDPAGGQHLKTADNNRPWFVVSDSARIAATIESIDAENRVLAVRDEDGEIRTLALDPLMDQFQKMRRGDRINAQYLREIAVYPAALTRGEMGMARTTLSDEALAVATIDIVQRRAVIEHIDYDARTVTLRISNERARAMHIPPRLGPLEKMKKGDHIVVRLTKVLAVGLIPRVSTP